MNSVEDKYPMLCRTFDDRHPSDLAICTRCESEFRWDPADGDPYDLCSTHGNAWFGECGGQIVFKWHPGSSCEGCGKLDFSLPLEDADGSYCSRVCQLQAEYARTLGKGRGCE